MEAACSAVEQEARARCPVDTGLLRGSITHAVEVSGAAVTGRVGTEIDYAPYVHEGTGLYARAGNGRKRVPWVYKDLKTGEIRATKGVRARPFLEEAGEAVAPKLAEYFQGILEG